MQGVKDNPIGGYFSLELPQTEEFHKNALRLNTGRNCLEYILRSRHYGKVYIPYYTCEVILEPFMKLGIPFQYYSIDQNLEISEDIRLQSNEALLYTNYYGLKQRYVELLATEFGNRLIVDNTQAFYSKPIKGIDTFYTCRKFFGVPDGAYLYTDALLNMELKQDISYDRMDFLLKRIDLSPEEGYADFRDESHNLIGQPVKRMSKLTERLMRSVDYDSEGKRRRSNYTQLHDALCSTNLLGLVLDYDAVPMVYPYMTNRSGLRNYLIENKIFIARYWNNVLEWTNSESLEYNIALNLLPVPIDQRYGDEEMSRIIDLILHY